MRAWTEILLLTVLIGSPGCLLNRSYPMRPGDLLLLEPASPETAAESPRAWLESAHAVAEAIRRAPSMRPDQILLVNLSGRGDKDLDTVTNALGIGHELGAQEATEAN